MLHFTQLVLGYGADEVIPLESTWQPNHRHHGHGVDMDDNATWAQKRDEWANHMWANRGHPRI